MQTAYNVDPVRGVVGAIASTRTHTVVPRIANGTVRPGQYVVFNGATLCNHPAAEPSVQTRGGIAVRNPFKQADGVYADGDVVDVLVDGDIWVASEVAVTANTQAFVRCVAGGGEELGAIRNDADGSDAFHVDGLYFRTAGTALVYLEVNKSKAP